MQRPSPAVNAAIFEVTQAAPSQTVWQMEITGQIRLQGNSNAEPVSRCAVVKIFAVDRRRSHVHASRIIDRSSRQWRRSFR